MKNRSLTERRRIASTLGYAIFDYYKSRSETANTDLINDAELRIKYKAIGESTHDTLSLASITDIIVKKHFFKRNEIILVCRRPGFIIGEKGVLIKYIKNYFDNDYKMKKYQSYDFKFEENKIVDYLDSYCYSY